MPEKREMKRLEELAKKKRRLFVLHQRLATDATLPSMGPLTQKRRSQVNRDSDGNPKTNKNIQTSTKESTTEKHDAAGTSRVKRSSAISSASDQVKPFTQIKVKQGKDTNQIAVLEHDSKSSEASVIQTVLTVPMARRSRDNSPLMRGASSAGNANNEHFETTEIARAAVNDLVSDVTKQTSQCEHASELDDTNASHALMLVKPVPFKKLTINNPVDNTEMNKRKKRRKRRIFDSMKVKRLQQPVKLVDTETQKRAGRPKGSKNKTWTQIAASKLKLRSAKRNDSNKVKKSGSKSMRKRTLSDEYDLVDERELKKKIRSTTEDMAPQQSGMDKKEDHDQNWTDSEEMGVHGSNISYSEIPNPDELDESFENVFTSEQTEIVPENTDRDETAKPETVLPEIKSKRVSRKTKSKNTETVFESVVPDRRRVKQVIPTVREYLVKPNGETIALSNEKVDHKVSEVIRGVSPEYKKPDQKLCETVYPEISPRKIQHRTQKSHVTTVTEIVVKPSGEATPLRIFRSTTEDLCISPELTVICSEKDAPSVTVIKPKKKKKKKDVMTYKSKRFSRKKMKQKKSKLVLPLDLKSPSNSSLAEDNSDIPVLSPTCVSDNQIVDDDLPSPGLNMPVLIKEQLLDPYYKLTDEMNMRPRGRPRIHPKKEPSGRSRGRPRKYFDALESPESVMDTEPADKEELNDSSLLQVQEDTSQINDESLIVSQCNSPEDKGQEDATQISDESLIVSQRNSPEDKGQEDATQISDESLIVSQRNSPEDKGQEDATQISDESLIVSQRNSPEDKGQEDATQISNESLIVSQCNSPEDNSSFDTQVPENEISLIREIIQSLLDKVCDDTRPHPKECDQIVHNTAVDEAIKPELKLKKKFKSMNKKRRRKAAMARSLPELQTDTDNKWKLDHSLKSGSPEGSTKLVFKRRRKVYKSMSERENSLFLAGVEELMKSEEKNEHVRQFMFRNKISRSPIQSLARKQKLEEEEYDKYEKQTRKQKMQTKLKEGDTDQIRKDASGSVQNLLTLCTPCSVYLTDFVKTLKLNTSKDGEGDDSFSSEFEEGSGSDSIRFDSVNSDQYSMSNDYSAGISVKSPELPRQIVDEHAAEQISDLSKRSTDKKALTESNIVLEKPSSSCEESLPSVPSVATSRKQEECVVTKSIVSQPHDSDASAPGQSSQFSRTNTIHQDSNTRTKYFCKACEFSSLDKNTMQTHIYIHLSDITFQCGYCNAKFLHHVAAQNHHNTLHAGTSTNIIKSRSVNESDYYNSVADPSNAPLIISLVVQGNVALDSSSLHTPTTRFVCTHCQYSTNVKEDIRQHVIDLHADKSLFICTLCDKSIYHSHDEITRHCRVTHPTRLDSFRKLPDYYDCEQLAEGNDRGRVDSRANIFERMTNLFSPSPPHSVDSENSNHFKRAREYLNIQEAWKNKTSAEADSTTAEDISNEDSSKVTVEDNSMEDDEAEPCQSTSHPESCVAESGGPCEDEKSGSDGTEADMQTFEKSLHYPVVNQLNQAAEDVNQSTDVKHNEPDEIFVEPCVDETKSASTVEDQLDKVTETSEVNKMELPVDNPDEDGISSDTPAVDHSDKQAVTSEIDNSETKQPSLDTDDGTLDSTGIDHSCKLIETPESNASPDTLRSPPSSNANSEDHQEDDKVEEICKSNSPLVDVDDNSNLKSSESVEDLTDSEAVIINLDEDIDDETNREGNRELVVNNHPDNLTLEQPDDIPTGEKSETCEMKSKQKSFEDVSSASKTSSENIKEKMTPVSGDSRELTKTLENESIDSEGSLGPSLANNPRGSGGDAHLKIVSVVSLNDTSATQLPVVKPPKAILPKAPVEADDLVIRNERLTCTYKCKECNVHSPFLSVMIDHLKLMHKSICVFSCPYCKVSEGRKPDFKANDDLRQHIAKFHPSHFAKKDISLSDSAKEIVQVIAIPTHIEPQRGNKANCNERDIYMCRKCNSHLPTLAFMYSHIESEHSDVFLYVCPECKTFKNKSDKVVYDHIEHIHPQCNSSPDLPLAMEDNLLSRVYSISKNGVYVDRSPNQVDKVIPKSSHSPIVSAGEKMTCLPSVTSSKSNISRDTVLKTLTCVNTLSTKTPTARKSIRQADDAKEAAVMKNSTTAKVPVAHPIVGSQLFTKSSTTSTSTIIQSQRNKSVLPTSAHSKHITSLMSKPAISFSGPRHSSKTVAQQLRERHALAQAATEMANRNVAAILGKESNPLSVRSKKFSMTDKLHRLGRQNAGVGASAIQKPVLNVPTMDKVRSLARPKSTDLPEASPVDLSVSQDMSRYPGILRPPGSSKDNSRTSTPVLGQDRSTPKQSLLFQRGVSPKLSPTPPQTNPQEDSDDLPPDAFKIFNLKPSKSPAPTKVSPSATPPASTAINAYSTQMPNIPPAYQFTPLQIAQLQRGVPPVPGIAIAQGFPGFVLVQPPAVNLQQLNPVSTSENSGTVRASTPLPTYLCHYCPQPRPMPQNEIIAHIQQAHKGCPIMFNPSSH